MRKIKFVFLVLISLIISISEAAPLVTYIDSPSTRADSRKSFFSHEYRRINLRRMLLGAKKSSVIPTGQVGMALSGGGIKSSAFQLGLMAGLHYSVDLNNKSLLSKMDYLSAVSGGSWAAGAYWAWKGSDKFLFNCLDEIVLGFPSAKCVGLYSILAVDQSDVESRNNWRETIEKNFLLNQDINFKHINSSRYSYLNKKPYLIINTTHSNTLKEQKSIKNFPFELTMDQVGTLADCNSNPDYCGLARRLRWININNPPHKGFFIKLAGLNHGLNISMDGPVFDGKKDGYHLSHAMASSGGLVAKLLSWHMNFSFKENDIPNIRAKYVLSDGGKTDNTGLVPLVERGIPLIIVSQMAEDSKLNFTDLGIAGEQCKKLLGRTVNVDDLKRPHFTDRSQNTFRQHNPQTVTVSSYNSPTGDLEGNILMVKPTQYNIDRFMTYLSKQRQYSKIYFHLLENEMDPDKIKRFPQNATFAFSYPQELIFAYYLLGRFIAENDLAPLVRPWQQ